MFRNRVLLLALAVTAFTVPATAGAWVYRDSSVDYYGTAGHCPSCCTNQPDATGQMDDGRAVFSGNQFVSDGFGSCGDKTWRTHAQFSWQSPPRLLAPVKPLPLDAAIKFADVVGGSPNNPLFGSVQLRLDYPKKTTQDQRDVLSTLAPGNKFNQTAAKTLTVTIPYGEVGKELYIEIAANAGSGGLGGYYFYHYAYDPDAVAPAANIPSGTAEITADGFAAPATTMPTTSGTNSEATAHSATDSMVHLGGAGLVLPVTTVATVLGGLLVSFGGLFAAGLAGFGQGGSTLASAVKGGLSGDGFAEWQRQCAKIYGTGKPDDPFRDYPDPDNPPWKAKYGDGSATNPFSDTAAAVIDHSPTPPDRQPVVAVTHDMPPVPAASSTPSGEAAPAVIHTEPLKFSEPPPEKLAAVPERPEPPRPAATTPEQLADLSNELQKAADRLKAEGKFIANGTFVEKVYHVVPHLAKVGARWLEDALEENLGDRPPSDPRALSMEHQLVGAPEAYNDSPPAKPDVDPNWGQCGEAVRWGDESMKEPIRRIFGPDAVITQIKLQSDVNPWGNHIANEVVAPSGERFVVDMWASMYEGKPKIYREDDWIEHWKNQPGISRSVTVRRGGERSSLEPALETCIRSSGIEDGLKMFRLGCKGEERKADTIINSFKSHPWVIPPEPDNI